MCHCLNSFFLVFVSELQNNANGFMCFASPQLEFTPEQIEGTFGLVVPVVPVGPVGPVYWPPAIYRGIEELVILSKDQRQSISVRKFPRSIDYR